tara:strand:- start:485 stop:1183 length:699 start_codon:yes stop_codon:yes gene_type:complete
MAVAEYGTTNISFSSTDTWANNVDGNDNISVSGSNGWARDIVDDPGANNLSVSGELRSNKLFYGNVVTKTNITAQVTLPYTSGTVNASSTLAIKNNSFNDNTTVRLVASPTYPYIFQKWTSDSGGSTSISTDATLNLTATDHTSVTNFYCWSTSPASNNASLGYHSSDASTACGASGTTVYWNADDGSNFDDAYAFYTDATLVTGVSAGKYSDGTSVLTVDSNGVITSGTIC